MPEEFEGVPKTLDEAVDALIAGSEPEAIAGVRRGEFDPTRLHHGLGTGIRNGWGLWQHSPLARWFYARGVYHADDMSGIILDAVKHRVRGEPFDLAGRVAYYQDFWRESGHDPRKEVEADLAKRGLPGLEG